jgi:hypothetical protein
MKKILLSLGLLFIVLFSNAQVTTSQDWTKTDCDGNSHTLFTYLNNNEVVVMMFEMGCSSCAAAGKVLENMKQVYDVSNPGKVHFFAMDYPVGETCLANTNAFMAGNGLTYPAFDHCLAEKNYYTSTSPMPMIVVTAGLAHNIFYIKNSYSTTGSDSIDIYNAIGLGITAGVDELNSITNMKVYPNPSESDPEISFYLNSDAKVKIDLVNVLGENVMTLVNEQKQKGNYKLEISAAALPKGVYFISAVIGNSFGTFKVIIQ